MNEENIKSLRTLIEMSDGTIEEFAELVGVTRRTMHRYLKTGDIPAPVARLISSIAKEIACRKKPSTTPASTATEATAARNSAGRATAREHTLPSTSPA